MKQRGADDAQNSDGKAPSCFYSLDAAFRFVYVSAAAEKLWQRSHAELIGQNIWEAFPTAVQSEGFARHQEAMRSRTVQKYEVFSPRYERRFEFSIRPLVTGGLMCFFEPVAPERENPEVSDSSIENAARGRR